MIDLSFFLRGKGSTDPNNYCAVYAQVHCDGHRSSAFSVKVKVPTRYWMVKAKTGKIKSSTHEYPISPSYYLADELNQSFKSLKKSAYDAQLLLEAIGEEVTAEAIKDILTKKRKIATSKKFIVVLDELKVSIEGDRAKNTLLNYRTRRNNINEFLLKSSYSNIKISQVRYKHFEKLKLWMIDQVNDSGKRRWCTNTINKHLTLFSQVLNYGVNKEYIKSNPLGILGLDYDHAKPPCYLEAAARKRIYDCKLKTLEVERDIAVFLYSTGLAYTDYESLMDEHLMRLPSGEWFIKKARDKTDVYSLIPLLEEAHEVIKKYGSIAKLPRPDMSDFNKALKILGEVCKSPYTLSTSVFRETFSSMMENEYMLSTRLIMFMMGHTNPRQLQNYSSVHPARILHELNKNEINIPFNVNAFKKMLTT